MNLRQTTCMGLVATALVSLGGCASRWERPVQADGTHCYVFGKQQKSACTPHAVPGMEMDQAAKRFTPDPAALTVYVVRHRANDGINPVPITMDSMSPVVSVPETFIRFRLKPGAHQLSSSWQGKTVTQTIQGQAGEVKFVQLAGSVWSWGGDYAWELDKDEQARRLTLKSRLIADVTAL